MSAILGQKKRERQAIWLINFTSPQSVSYLREQQVSKLQGRYSVKSSCYFHFEPGEVKLYRVASVAVDD